MDLVEAAPPPLLPPGKPNDPELKRPESPAPVLAPRPNEEKSVIGGVTKLITVMSNLYRCGIYEKITVWYA